MNKTIRRILAIIMVLAVLVPVGGALAAQPSEPLQAESVVQTEEKTGGDISRSIAVRQILQASSPAKPKASKAAGTYSSAVTVKLTTTTKSAKIYYTTDGTKPTTKSKTYKSALSVKKNTTIKAIAVKSGKSSSVLTVAYKIRAAVPKVSKTAGTYTDSVSVKLTSDTSGAKIYYTTDGSTPTKKSTLYSKTLKLTETTTIKALAIKSGMSNSKVVTAKYTIVIAPYTSREGYLACTEDEKMVYTAIYDGLAVVAEEIDMPVDIKIPAALRVMMRVDFDNPELFAWGENVEYSYYTSSNYLVTLYPEYMYTKSKFSSAQNAMKEAAEAIAKKAEKEETVVDRIKVIHDEIILNAVYNDDAYLIHMDGGYVHNAYTAYGVLVEKTGVCESYSRAFQYICQLLDIPVMVVVGDAGGAHMWNMVQVDGVWYNIDLTWDDSQEYGDDYVSYDYFLISDKTLGMTHTPAPVAKGNQHMEDVYNYSTLPKAPEDYNRDALADAA